MRFEPESALDGGVDGLDFYRAIAESWLPGLKSGGFFMLESGEDQPEKIIDMINGTWFDAYGIKDFYGVERFVAGRRKALE